MAPSLAKKLFSSALRLGRQDIRELEGLEGVPVALEELALELHPVEAEGVQEALEHVHPEQDTDGDRPPDGEGAVDGDSVHGVARHHRRSEGLLEEDQGELLMRQGQSPDTEVARGVGHGPQHVLDGLDDLVDEDLAEVELLTM